MGGTIARIQSEHKEWLDHNFPNQPPLDPFLGMVEELGEMSHAILKYRQGIRGHAHGDMDSYADALVDGLGDLFVFMCSFATAHNLDLEHCILKTWGKVQQRDWQADPETGGEGGHLSAV